MYLLKHLGWESVLCLSLYFVLCVSVSQESYMALFSFLLILEVLIYPTETCGSLDPNNF